MVSGFLVLIAVRFTIYDERFNKRFVLSVFTATVHHDGTDLSLDRHFLSWIRLFRTYICMRQRQKSFVFSAHINGITRSIHFHACSSAACHNKL